MNVKPSRDLPVGTTLHRDGLLSRHGSWPSEPAKGWAHSQQQEWNPGDVLPEPWELKMTTVKKKCQPPQEKGAKITCIYLQCGHHQIPNPQGLPFDLWTMTLHDLLVLCWQECTGPGRIKKIVIYKKQPSYTVIQSVMGMKIIPVASKGLFGSPAGGFPPIRHTRWAQCRQLSEQHPILQGALSWTQLRPHWAHHHHPFLHDICSLGFKLI